MTFDAVIFDMDGTLLDTEALIIEAGLVAIAAHGHIPRRELLTAMVGTVGDTGDQILTEAYGPSFDLDAINATWREEASLRYDAGVPLRPGAAELLDHLITRSLPRALATNSRTAHAHDSLHKAGIRDRFSDHLIFGRDAVARPKPAPDLFLHAANAMGETPDRCLVFEDSDAGVAAARAAGMTVIHVPDQRAPETDFASYIAPNLLDGARWAGLI